MLKIDADEKKITAAEQKIAANEQKIAADKKEIIAAINTEKACQDTCNTKNVTFHGYFHCVKFHCE